MAEPATNQGLLESILQMGEEFAAIAAGSPQQAVLLAVGALLVLFSMGVFGVLSAGAVFGAIKDYLPSGSPPPQAR